MTESETTAASKSDRADGVKRMLNNDEPPVAPAINSPEPAEAAEGAEDAGTSLTAGGEEIAARDGKEAARDDTGTDGSPADRPTGTSTPPRLNRRLGPTDVS